MLSRGAFKMICKINPLQVTVPYIVHLTDAIFYDQNDPYSGDQ
jgi:hypothetical protein